MKTKDKRWDLEFGNALKSYSMVDLKDFYRAYDGASKTMKARYLKGMERIFAMLLLMKVGDTIIIQELIEQKFTRTK